MSRSIKYTLFVFLPILCLVVFQVEKGRMDTSHHKFGVDIADHSDISADSDDDDSISMLAEDDDSDDSSETLARITPASTSLSICTANFQYESPVVISVSRQISYRDVSPSFLRVFRI